MAIQICDVHTDQRLKEQTQHGDLLFPVACYEDDMAVDNVPMHWHEELEYILATAGTVTVQVGTEKRTLEKGAGVLINTGVLHAVQHVPGGASVLRSLVIHPEVIGGSPHSCYWQELVVPFCGREDLPFLLLGGSRPDDARMGRHRAGGGRLRNRGALRALAGHAPHLRQPRRLPGRAAR